MNRLVSAETKLQARRLSLRSPLHSDRWLLLGPLQAAWRANRASASRLLVRPRELRQGLTSERWSAMRRAPLRRFHMAMVSLIVMESGSEWPGHVGDSGPRRLQSEGREAAPENPREAGRAPPQPTGRRGSARMQRRNGRRSTGLPRSGCAHSTRGRERQDVRAPRLDRQRPRIASSAAGAILADGARSANSFGAPPRPFR